MRRAKRAARRAAMLVVADFALMHAARRARRGKSRAPAGSIHGPAVARLCEPGSPPTTQIHRFGGENHPARFAPFAL
jgi:hypothetical protein